MKEKLKEIHFSSMTVAILTIILGILMIAFRSGMLYALARIIGAVIAIVGIVQLIRNLTDDAHILGLTVLYIVITALGLWMLAFPKPITNFIPIVIGIFIIFHGADTIRMSLRGKEVKAPKWGLMLFSGVLSILIGLICIVRSEWFLSAGMVLLGILLIYDGVSALFVTGKVSSLERVVDSTAKDLD
ncbi:MAG: DUF308 domain-containing protein [Lachnospiraceae bacterium]|nr:DUF308 domain-containing protein [Lachnospiraceae bacterium]